MVNIVRGKVDVGDIVGFITPFLPYSTEEFALVLNGHKIIPVRIYKGQLDYVKENYCLGKKVALGFYGGQWHIGMPEWYSTNNKQVDKPISYELRDEDISHLLAVKHDFSMSVDSLLE